MMRKKLFHPTQFYQQQSTFFSGSFSQVNNQCSIHPNDIVRMNVYRVEDEEQNLSSYYNLADTNNQLRK